MITAPMWFTWDGEAMQPRAPHLADQSYVIGQRYRMGEIEERSEVSHNHQFAWLNEAWQSLPDHLQQEYPSADFLRRRALIATGWCNVTDYPCGTKAEAARWAEFLRREIEAYDVVVQSESVVRVFRPRSQARGKMNKADFQASKTAVLEWVAALLEVEPATLERQAAAA